MNNDRKLYKKRPAHPSSAFHNLRTCEAFSSLKKLPNDKYPKVHIPSSSNSRSRSASWSLSPCNRPLVAIAMDGGTWSRNSLWPSNPEAAAAWALACAWRCWQAAYILRLVAIAKIAITSQSYKHMYPQLSYKLILKKKKRYSSQTSSISRSAK